MRYESPDTIAKAVSLLSEAEGLAYVLAGGTDLLVKMKGGFVEPDLVVDIKRIKALSEITETAAGFRIGAAVPGAALSEHKALVQAWPGVVEGANLIGSKQVQGRCTMVGNLCNASPAADSVPALVAAQAQVIIASPSGERTMNIADIPLSPGRTHLKKGDVITAILLPKRAPHSSDAYLRFIPRTEMDIAVVSAAVNLTRDAAGLITAAHVALGAVAATVVMVPDAAKALIGNKLSETALEQLAQACSAACKPIDDKRGTVEFRTRVAGVLARRAAEIAYRRAGEK